MDKEEYNNAIKEIVDEIEDEYGTEEVESFFDIILQKADELEWAYDFYDSLDVIKNSQFGPEKEKSIPRYRMLRYKTIIGYIAYSCLVNDITKLLKLRGDK